LFLDASQSVRLGPIGKNALARLVDLAAAATRAALANRDPVGLIIFDEHAATYTLAARGPRHLVEILRKLGDVARLSPTAPRADADELLAIAYPFAAEVYPDLLRDDVNRFPSWLPWLAPRPEYLRTLTLGDAVLPFLKQRFSRSARRRYAWRKRLAAIFALRERLDVGCLAMMLEDDAYFAAAAQRFLADHHVPYPVPLYDWRGNYLFASTEKITILANSLLRAVRRARDNELYVLFVDMFELGAGLEPALRAARVALAKHHRVVVVSPWQPEIPLPDTALPVAADPNSPGQILREATTRHYHRAFENVRRAFGRLGVPVVCAAQGEPAQLILDRMEQLRAARIRA
jgi:uncharacterized protein (DUF58 family)